MEKISNEQIATAVAEAVKQAVAPFQAELENIRAWRNEIEQAEIFKLAAKQAKEKKDAEDAMSNEMMQAIKAHGGSLRADGQPF